MGDDIMTRPISKLPKVSRITMAVLQDTSWYKPRYRVSIPLLFGRRRGEEFFNFESDVVLDEFCEVEGESRCFPGRNFTSRCQTSDATNNGFAVVKEKQCTVNDAEVELLQEAGERGQIEAKCVVASADGVNFEGKCFTVACFESGLRIYLDSDVVVECDSAGQTLDVSGQSSELASLLCPNNFNLCSRIGRAQPLCGGNGQLTRWGACFCLPCY